jgi:creatinine amidohydrolase
VHVHDLTWLQLAARLEHDDRIVLPLGSTEQHAHLSLGTDTIEVERIAVEAAAPLGVPVLPALPYGVAPQLAAFPGSPSIRVETYAAFLADILDSLVLQGFRRLFVLNGHFGNALAREQLRAWERRQATARLVWHDWWAPPAVWALMGDPPGSPPDGHASWVESFPWVRVAGVELPAVAKPPVALDELAPVGPHDAKALLGDGSYGGPYDLGPARAVAIHDAAVVAARAALAAL